jgi:hypothetical protein
MCGKVPVSESSSIEGVTSSSQISPFVEKADPISKHVNLGKYKTMVMDPDGTRKDD